MWLAILLSTWLYMGLGDSPVAYMNQLSHMHRGQYFSYCLSPNSLSPKGWLEFGLGAVPQNLQEKQASNISSYFISLTGIAINDESLSIPGYDFRLTGEKQESRGVYLDPTTVITRLPRNVYEVFKGVSVAQSAHIWVGSKGWYCLADSSHDQIFSIIGNVQMQEIQVSYDLPNGRACGISTRKLLASRVLSVKGNFSVHATVTHTYVSESPTIMG